MSPEHPATGPEHRAESPVSRRAALAGGATAVLVTAGGLGLARLLTGGRGAPTGSPPTPRPSTAAPAGSAASASPTPTPAPTVPESVRIGGGPVPGYSNRTILGAYLELSGMTLREAVALRRRQLGRDYRIIHVFYAWTDRLPGSVDGAPADSIPMFSWRGTYHDEILSGKHDSLIRANARRLARDGKPKFLRWGWEMNGSWYAWSGPKNGNNPAGYVECWKYLRKLFRDEGANNISWVWSINWNSQPDTEANRFQAYYPGDEHVDWVAISGYNLHRERPATMFDEMYKEYAARKPMMISEVGSVDYGGNTKGDWNTQFSKYVAARPNIAAVCWFDTDTHHNYSETWRVDTDAHSLATYREMARSKRFSG